MCVNRYLYVYTKDLHERTLWDCWGDYQFVCKYLLHIEVAELQGHFNSKNYTTPTHTPQSPKDLPQDCNSEGNLTYPWNGTQTIKPRNGPPKLSPCPFMNAGTFPYCYGHQYVSVCVCGVSVCTCMSERGGGGEMW